MKVIFLDIDGVICTRKAAGWPRWKARPPVGRQPMRTSSRRPPRAIDLTCLKRLGELCGSTGALVVVSSTWRLDRDVPTIFRQRGFDGPFHEDWRTDLDGPTRGDEIGRWLADHAVDAYVVIDDRANQIAVEQRPFLVATDYFDGFQDRHLNAAARLLCG